MKKRMAVFAAAAVLLIRTPAAAQSAVGFRGGLTLTDVSFESEEEMAFESKTGVVFGVFAQFPLREELAFQLGLNYTEKGADAGGADQGFGIDLTYVEFPAMIVWSLPSSAPVGARLMAGPVVSFELSCKQRGLGGLTPSSDCEPTGFVTSSTDLGVQIGVGMVWDFLDAASLFLDGGYDFGLTNWRSEAPGDESARNRALLFTVGAIFPLR